MILRYDQGMTTHHDATDHPLTEGRAQDIYSDTNPVGALRAAFDAGREHERGVTEENLARLRDTPVGRALKAEGWDEAIYDTGVWKQLFEVPHNPYQDGTA